MSVSPFAPSIKSQKMRHAYYIKSGAVEVHGVQFENLIFQLSIQLLVNFGSILKNNKQCVTLPFDISER